MRSATRNVGGEELGWFTRGGVPPKKIVLVSGAGAIVNLPRKNTKNWRSKGRDLSASYHALLCFLHPQQSTKFLDFNKAIQLDDGTVK